MTVSSVVVSKSSRCFKVKYTVDGTFPSYLKLSWNEIISPFWKEYVIPSFAAQASVCFFICTLFFAKKFSLVYRCNFYRQDVRGLWNNKGQGFAIKHRLIYYIKGSEIHFFYMFYLMSNLICVKFFNNWTCHYAFSLYFFFNQKFIFVTSFEKFHEKIVLR